MGSGVQSLVHAWGQLLGNCLIGCSHCKNHNFLAYFFIGCLPTYTYPMDFRGHPSDLSHHPSARQLLWSLLKDNNCSNSSTDDWWRKDTCQRLFAGNATINWEGNVLKTEGMRSCPQPQSVFETFPSQLINTILCWCRHYLTLAMGL